MYQYNNNINYMIQYDMHQYITISIMQYENNMHPYMYIECMLQYNETKK